jgi:hypothetical protein
MYDDLEEYRGIVRMVLRNFGYEDVSMEYDVREEIRPLELSLDEVARCDLYVALIAWRYGYIPRENNPRGLSITELEYERAVELEKTRLIFVVNPPTKGKPYTVDKDPLRISAFRERVLRENAVRSVTSPRALQDVLTRALANLDARPLSTPRLSPETVALIRSLAASPERIARLLASIVLADRSRLALLESPNTAGVADALTSQNAQRPDGVAALIGRMNDEPFEPDPLWLAWITRIHRERLDEIGAEVLRVSGLAQPG